MWSPKQSALRCVLRSRGEMWTPKDTHSPDPRAPSHPKSLWDPNEGQRFKNQNNQSQIPLCTPVFFSQSPNSHSRHSQPVGAAALRSMSEKFRSALSIPLPHRPCATPSRIDQGPSWRHRQNVKWCSSSSSRCFEMEHWRHARSIVDPSHSVQLWLTKILQTGQCLLYGGWHGNSDGLWKL